MVVAVLRRVHHGGEEGEDSSQVDHLLTLVIQRWQSQNIRQLTQLWSLTHYLLEMFPDLIKEPEKIPWFEAVEDEAKVVDIEMNPREV